jgi:hypothetical protein
MARRMSTMTAFVTLGACVGHEPANAGSVDPESGDARVADGAITDAGVSDTTLAPDGGLTFCQNERAKGSPPSLLFCSDFDESDSPIDDWQSIVGSGGGHYALVDTNCASPPHCFSAQGMSLVSPPISLTTGASVTVRFSLLVPTLPASSDTWTIATLWGVPEAGVSSGFTVFMQEQKVTFVPGSGAATQKVVRSGVWHDVAITVNGDGSTVFTLDADTTSIAGTQPPLMRPTFSLGADGTNVGSGVTVDNVVIASL